MQKQKEELQHVLAVLLQCGAALNADCSNNALDDELVAVFLLCKRGGCSMGYLVATGVACYMERQYEEVLLLLDRLYLLFVLD